VTGIGKVTRISPNTVHRLANWVEENFDNVDQFVVTFAMKDGTTMTVYDAYSYVEALGIAAISTDCLQKIAADDEFFPKGR